MKKILVYSVLAVILGLTLTLVPPALLVTLAENKASYAMPHALSEGLEKLERSYATLDKPKYSVADLGIVAFCLIIALSAYMFLKSKMLH